MNMQISIQLFRFMILIPIVSANSCFKKKQYDAVKQSSTKKATVNTIHETLNPSSEQVTELQETTVFTKEMDQKANNKENISNKVQINKNNRNSSDQKSDNSDSDKNSRQTLPTISVYPDYNPTGSDTGNTASTSLSKANGDTTFSKSVSDLFINYLNIPPNQEQYSKKRSKSESDLSGISGSTSAQTEVTADTTLLKSVSCSSIDSIEPPNIDLLNSKPELKDASGNIKPQSIKQETSLRKKIKVKFKYMSKSAEKIFLPKQPTAEKYENEEDKDKKDKQKVSKIIFSSPKQ